MIELLYAILIVYVISIIFYFIFPTFQYLKLYFYCFHLFLWILLISLNPYKKHYLWDEPDFNPIQELPYPPINNITIINDSNMTFRDIKVAHSNRTYSIIESHDYPIKCTSNYYIHWSQSCPITDIIVEYSNFRNYSDYKKIEISNGYIYYKRENEYGKFYDSVIIDKAYSNNYILINNTNKTIKFSYSFDYQNVETIKRLEENKLFQPFKKFKNYKNSSDFICLFISMISIAYYFMGNKKDSIWNYFKIIDIILQFVLFTLYLVRFILFGKVKKFFKENKDLFKNEHLQFNRTKYFIDYFPSKISINSFPLALSIAFIFFFLLSLFINKKCSAFEDNSNNDQYISEEKSRIFYLTFPFFIIYVICFILDIVNDSKIKKIYKYIMANWEASPIFSIEISTEKEYELGHIYSKEKEFKFYSWKNKYFKINKRSGYNYLYSLEPRKSGYTGEIKICGKDSWGNSLFFTDCPISDIFIGNNENINEPRYNHYKKLNLGNNNYLFYTNEETNKNILVDIKVGFPNATFELNIEKANELCNPIYNKGFYKEIGGKCKNYDKFNTVPFYNEIDHWDLYDFLQNTFELTNINYIGEINLYALTYQGINFTKIGRNYNIQKFKLNMDKYISLSVVKNVFSSFNIIYYLFFNIFLYKNSIKNIHSYISFFFLFLLFFHFIIIIVCLSFNIKYVQNIMYQINNDFERKRSNYFSILFIFFLDMTFFAYYFPLTMTKIKDNFLLCYKRNYNNNHQVNIQKNNQNNNIRGSNSNDNNINNSNDTDRRRSINNNEDQLCIFCCDERRCIVFGCGHICYCLNCYNKTKETNKNCPICRKPIENIIRMFNI